MSYFCKDGIMYDENNKVTTELASACSAREKRKLNGNKFITTGNLIFYLKNTIKMNNEQ